MIKKNNFNKTISDILDDGKVESIPIKNIDVIKYIIDDELINDNLYNGFANYYDFMYGDDNSCFLMKIEDMIHNLNLLINNCIIDNFSINDKDIIKDAIHKIVEDGSIDLYSAVSYDDFDNELVEFQIKEIGDFLPHNI